MVTGQSEHLYARCTTEALGASQMFSRISNAGKIPVAISRNDWSWDFYIVYISRLESYIVLILINRNQQLNTTKMYPEEIELFLSPISRLIIGRGLSLVTAHYCYHIVIDSGSDWWQLVCVSSASLHPYISSQKSYDERTAKYCVSPHSGPCGDVIINVYVECPSISQYRRGAIQ